MARARTTKGLAKRISLDYFKKRHPFRSWKWRLSLGAGAISAAAALAAISGAAERVLLPGPVSAPHAFFGSDCSSCHGGGRASRYFLTIRDERCLTCHDGPVHHESQTFMPPCAECHAEHRGRALARTKDAACVRCHASLTTRQGPTRIETRVVSFSPGGHPELGPLRAGERDKARIRLNHQVHLKPGLRGPEGAVTLQCSSCHLPDAAQGRMKPVAYQERCAACHPLAFDLASRFSAGLVAPHDKPDRIHEFLTRTFQDEIARRPARLSEPDLPVPAMQEASGRRRPGTEPLPPPARTAQEWVIRQVAIAETVLFRRDCHLCHEMTWPKGGDGRALSEISPRTLPEISPPSIPASWLPHASFSHRAHRVLACVACHKAKDSQETSDVLLPPIASCMHCHRQGGTSADCALCHLYHDRARERGLDGPLLLPVSLTAGPPLR